MTMFLNQTWLVPCPKCKAGVGNRCIALRDGKKKKGAEVMSHYARWKAAAQHLSPSAASHASTKEE